MCRECQYWDKDFKRTCTCKCEFEKEQLVPPRDWYRCKKCGHWSIREEIRV